jgi:hypothetical protein
MGQFGDGVLSADHMLDIYWSQIHVLYPFLHRPTFETTYAGLWCTDFAAGNDQLLYCTINAIFALSCQFQRGSVAKWSQESTAEVYGRRALQLLQLNILDCASLELIQALLISAQFLQSTESPCKCWILVGVAIRAAQGLGINNPETTASMRTQFNREYTRRLWHGCIFMDR